MITQFLLNLFLAVLWMFMWGSFDVYTLVAGFAIGYLLIGFAGRSMGAEDNYGSKVANAILFGLYFIRILVVANLMVAKESSTPGYGMSPAIIKYPVDGMTELQVTSLANAITLTPGTLSVDVAPDADYLYVHCMYWRDKDAALKDLDELKHRLLTEVFS